MTPNFVFDGHTNNCFTVLEHAFPDNETIRKEITAFRSLPRRTRLKLANCDDLKMRVEERAFVLGFRKCATAGAGPAFGIAFNNSLPCIVTRTHEHWWYVAPRGFVKVPVDDVTCAWSVGTNG